MTFLSINLLHFFHSPCSPPEERDSPLIECRNAKSENGKTRERGSVKHIKLHLRQKQAQHEHRTCNKQVVAVPTANRRVPERRTRIMPRPRDVEVRRAVRRRARRTWPNAERARKLLVLNYYRTSWPDVVASWRREPTGQPLHTTHHTSHAQRQSLTTTTTTTTTHT